ncbi:hypothetical protein OHC33_008222 [Knufia fluminis]|uniref:Uncharacterized protein n=1 Tax=Knufia fluminis TaxID=191047 RepID=A0AAN8I3X8_9EURO|nr:hypothetical protein OHC33_008222 [Knufia fluminis]
MSKSSVPDVYAKVIKDVCEASRVDFEEGGVDLGALELLKQGWQKRLSAEHIAIFPWDPKPEPVAKPEPTPGPSSAKPVHTLPSNGAANTPPSSSSTPGLHVKQENQQYATQPPMQANYGGQRYPSAQPVGGAERAASLLKQQYGDQAAAQVAQLQQQNQSRIPPSAYAQPQQQQQSQQPYIKQEFKQEDGSQDYRQTYNPNTIKTSQVDGAADAREEYETEIAHRRALVAQHRQSGDRLIRDRVLASQQSLEAGGLMMPIDAQRSTKSKPTVAERKPVSSSLSAAQGDAAGDDEEDEDAINSDLDDPDELDGGNEGDDDVSNVMLCTYDKVQRVKNKWKCTLKDGVLKVDGAEFVFHKGQGEFEW